MGWLSLRHPVIAAPMAGGPSTPALVAAVSGAGGLGVLAGGYLTAAALAEQVRAVRSMNAAPFGANLFVPDRAPVDGAALTAYAERLAPEAQRLGVPLGPVTGGDDGWAEKIDVLLAERVPVVSFAFGCPDPAAVAALRAGGATVLITVTTPGEAIAAADLADALVVQGVEAGAHRGGFTDADGVGEYGVLALLRLVARATPQPLIAAGGIADGAGIAAVLAAGAVAAQLGTAFLRCPEAGTGDLHRAVLAAAGPTAAETGFTRAFTGRRARAIVNRFVADHSTAAPAAYPHVHQLTAPLRAKARSSGDAESLNLWAGQAYSLGTDRPAAQLVEHLGTEARAALAAAAARLP